ncbi:hypothetical protein SAMN05216371_5478 [Streptomyces sp. TLI_053]|uniref:hypothetical protein n=1 Tax=Streptomyces sp. TLI_053 TaxID=1855352 RepID=UPI00087D7394|nr:hypothetical protein [Streptomyces sp. TLI_053]SDT77580.1 hypothetical protein SAMN05216371_5478 [Streptomyces sp. TLI_053]
MDAVRVSALRDRLAGTGWLEAVGGFAGELRHAVTRRGAGELLLVGTTGYEPWHLAAHLEDEAAWSDVPRLAPTLLRHRVPAAAPAHLAHGLGRLTGAGRGATVLVVAPTAAGDTLLERVHDARRQGATVLALEGAAPSSPGGSAVGPGGSAGPGDLAGLAHGRLAVGTAEEEPFDLAQHLVSAAAGQPPGQRSALGRLAALAERLTAGPTISRW